MSPHRIIGVGVALVLALGGVARPAAQAKHPNFSGTWQQDIDASKALTEKKGQVWRVAGAGSGGSPPPGSPAPVVMVAKVIITQSDTELVIERSYEGEITSRTVLKLDGSVSVNASRTSSSRSTSAWKGASLVTTGTTEFDFSDGQAVNAKGEPITHITRQVVTTRSLMPDGTMQIEDRSTQDGQERVSWMVYVRLKSS